MAVGVASSVPVAVAVAVSVGVPVGVAVGVALAVASKVAVAVAVAVALGVSVGVAVGVVVGVVVGVPVGVLVAVVVGVPVGVPVGVLVGVGVSVAGLLNTSGRKAAGESVTVMVLMGAIWAEPSRPRWISDPWVGAKMNSSNKLTKAKATVIKTAAIVRVFIDLELIATPFPTSCANRH